MKILLAILISAIFLFGGLQNDNSIRPKMAKKDCIEASKAQDVQSFYSENPDSQTRNKPEFWEDGAFKPIMKHD